MIAFTQTLASLFIAALAAAGTAHGFVLGSPAFASGGTIPHQYSYSGHGCDGRNTSPELVWSAAPEGTVSFALTVFDPDARGGVGWWHWVAFDIPAQVTRLQTNAGSGSGDLMPEGAVQGRNDFQTIGYGGPCPPPGSPHHYHFTLYALDERLAGLSPLTSGPTLVKAMRGHVLAKAELMGLFAR